MSREGVFLLSNEMKRNGATATTRNLWDSHQRKVERLNERRQMHDASILRELQGQSTQKSNEGLEDWNHCGSGRLTEHIVPPF